MISHVLPTYNRAPIAFERGEGSWAIATDGTRYLDLGAGIAVNALGHANPDLVAALTEQAGRIWHVSNLYQIPEQERLADLLVEHTFADTAFITNSGTEAAELAIKMVRKYWSEQGDPDRYEILTFEGAFHGRSTGAIAAAGSEKMVKGFGPLMPGFRQLPWGDMEALKAAISDRTAAVMLEPVQGEGGIRAFPAPFLEKLRALADRHGLLLILDEVLTGIGRTGRLFAYQWSPVEPDIMAIAKGIGGGFPVGACLATERAAAGMTPGVHGTTFGGNPLAMAVGNAVLDVVLEDGFLQSVQERALNARQMLASIVDEFPLVFEDVRGNGLLLGLKCRMANTAVLAAVIDSKLLAVTAGDNVLRLLPPLTVSDEEIREAGERIRAAAAIVSASAERGAS